jgi:hypothetical protein
MTRSIVALLVFDGRAGMLAHRSRDFNGNVTPADLRQTRWRLQPVCGGMPKFIFASTVHLR